MKKSALILLVLAYAASVFGIGLKEFYCCGKYVSSSLQYAPDGSKHKCSMEAEKKGCCQTKVQFHKVADSHGAASLVAADEKQWSFTGIATQVVFDDNKPCNQISENINSPHAPPSLHSVPAYKFNCNYRL